MAGTDDEIVIGANQMTFQQDGAALGCQTQYQYVDPGQASATFSNFDLTGGARVRYYAPSDATYVPDASGGGTLGTPSTAAVWNAPGDVVSNPETGWWRIVTCADPGNQFIQEGQNGVPTYLEQPPTPALALAIDDGVTQVAVGQSVTYGIVVSNTASGATAGAANDAVVSVTLPAGLTYSSCAAPTPADGTWVCSESAGVVTFTQDGWINAGEKAELELTATIGATAVDPVVVPATVTYQDLLGNPFPPASGSDSDALVVAADLGITLLDSADPVQPGQAFSYTIGVTNTGPAEATAVSVSQTVPPQFPVTGVTVGSGTCSTASNTVSCSVPTLAVAASWSATVNVTVDPAAVPGTYQSTATVSAAEADLDSVDDTAVQATTIGAAADLGVVKTASTQTAAPGEEVTYTIAVTNAGPSPATNLALTDAVPPALDVTDVEAAVGTCSSSGNDVSCSTDSLEAATSWTVTIDATVDADAARGTVTNTATVSADEPDPDTTDDSGSVDLEIREAAGADLTVGMTTSASELSEGDTLRFVVTVGNDGPADGTGVVLSDPAPQGLELVASTPDVGDYDPETGEWSVGALVAGA
ncbi:MAG TPA: DUF11 domain-containing protein, partial [Actinomycetota bacterium]|nr:DUF11 domain-containing protein [Actinomycetota bacterium]